MVPLQDGELLPDNTWGAQQIHLHLVISSRDEVQQGNNGLLLLLFLLFALPLLLLSLCPLSVGLRQERQYPQPRQDERRPL